MNDSSPGRRVHPRLEVTQEGPLLTVTLDHPQTRNAQVPSQWLALARLGRTLPPDVRVVIVRGAGESFSSGLDRALLTPEGLPGERSLVQQAQGSEPELVDEIASYQKGFAVWADVPAITIAAVQGYAVGAGFQLALACDLRIVAEDAQLIMRETALGLVPDLTGTHALVRQVGYSRALEICATGRPVGAGEAVDTGLASLRVPAGELGEAARDLADAVMSNPPQAVRELKRLLRFAQGSTPEQQHYAERTAQARLLSAMAAGRNAPG
ncbi:enoyl-CoA hydratase/isomerase family protein [Luteipulveratus flavus]|uniref:Enoyl-CoA hydratase/isomerase family protein n=1 Tax=Luteipulveratus flavus TaxID=3031728 RepID=A0ABT6C5H0_9MICO|nr:enoyl-CoA hydratase/isomerase family protein [Luteipulveratus sp. YIM 133296]MDF8264025.1 enoyl-CoA hydratase/isomerase family protein [Luteipulveratus sp. YIM 133296]